MAPLPTGAIENACANRQAHARDESSDESAFQPRIEEPGVFPQVQGIEVRLPPLTAGRQKKTGSRYAPNFSSIAARISYSVQ